MQLKTRAAAALITVLAIFAAASTAVAQTYPDHPVKVIVGYAPGGPIDIVARLMADRLAEVWGKPVVVENLTGAGSNIAGDRVAKSAPDGYTLLMGSNALLAINPSLYSKMTFDPNKDLIPISEAVYSPNILVVPNNLPVKNVQELVAYAKAHASDKLTFASAGVGTTQHLAGELFKAMAHVDIAHVPYRGAAPVITDLLAGRLTMFFGAIAPLIPLVKAGKVRALAVTSDQMSGILTSGNSFHIIKLLGREEAGQRQLNDPQVQASIRQNLMNEKEQLLKAAYIEVLRNRAKIENFLAARVVEDGGAKAAARK